MTRRVSRQQVSPWGFVGIGGMACMLFLDLGTADVAPWWVTVAFLLLWLVLFAMALRWFESHPQRVAWLPAVAFAVWLPVIAYGTRQLGWG
jgi:hypothetical protein